MTQYEYKVLAKPDATFINMKGLERLVQETEKELSALGREGWQLVQWRGGLMIFQREK